MSSALMAELLNITERKSPARRCPYAQCPRSLATMHPRSPAGATCSAWSGLQRFIKLRCEKLAPLL